MVHTFTLVDGPRRFKIPFAQSSFEIFIYVITRFNSKSVTMCSNRSAARLVSTGIWNVIVIPDNVQIPSIWYLIITPRVRIRKTNMVSALLVTTCSLCPSSKGQTKNDAQYNNPDVSADTLL